MRAGPLLVVPAAEKGRGGGHLVRSAALVRELRSRGREACLYLPSPPAPSVSDCMTPLEESWLIRDPDSAARGPWAFIILDRFRTPRKELAAWAALGPLVGIDEGGAGRDSFDFLIDLLPGPPGLAAPNRLDPSLLPLPRNRRPAFYVPPARRAGPFRVLVSFGAEDPAGLTLPAALALVRGARGKDRAPAGAAVRVLTGDPRSREILGRRGIPVLAPLPALGEELASYDLLVSHFGLTAFEALHARVPVLLVSPGAYHKSLARRGGFPAAGSGRGGARRLGGVLFHRGRPREEFLRALGERCRGLAERYGLEGDAPGTLGALLAPWTAGVPPACPGCGAPRRIGPSPGNRGGRHPVLARFEDRTYRRCPRCGMVYMLRSSPPPIEYETDYFFGFYKKQYGKTYLEDFPNLIRAGKERLRRIGAMLGPARGPEERRLLDIGCAYGPFLAAAREGGFLPVGIDPAPDAIRYVREELRIPAFQGFFPLSPEELPPDAEGRELLMNRSFSVVSLWYVIEHFENPRLVLEEISRLLKPGGVLAFSTPSFSGVSGRKSPRRFLEKSPPDHWTIWTPRRCSKLLAACGFRLKRIVVTGHHPERFPLAGRFLGNTRGPVYRFLYLLSRIFRLGDTFEVYGIVRDAGRDKK